MYTILSQGRVSMRGCCHVRPWLNVLSDVALSYFMLFRLTIIFPDVSLIQEEDSFNPLVKIQTHERFNRTLFIRTKTQSANFRGNPLRQATKRYLNNS